MYNNPARRAAYRAKLKADRNRRMLALADLVADGWSIKAASAHLGFSQQSGSAMFRDMKIRLGWQAQ